MEVELIVKGTQKTIIRKLKAQLNDPKPISIDMADGSILHCRVVGFSAKQDKPKVWRILLNCEELTG